MSNPATVTIESLRKPLSRGAAAALLALVVFTVPATFESNWGEAMEITGFGLLILAAIGRVWCSIYISGRKNKELCTQGPYQLTRNPLYFFSFVGVIGFAVATQSMVLVMLAAVIYLLYYEFVIRSEEARLSSLFGERYDAYCESTPRFFPALRPLTGTDTYSVNPAIIEKALKEVVWFLFAIVALEIVELVHAKGYLVWAVLPF